MIRMDIGSISRLGRNTQGVRVIKLRDGDSIADVTKIIVEEDEHPGAAAGEDGNDTGAASEPPGPAED
jgi:DNA gyrase subunit A